MADMINLPSWKLGTGDLIQQIATLIWLHKGDEGKDLLELVTGFRVAHELFNRMTEDTSTDALRNQCIMNIVTYIKKHPKATEKELTQVVEKEIELFRQKLEGTQA